MKKFFTIIKKVFLITDHLISSLLYAGLILIITIFVWVGFIALFETYNVQYVWELAVFAFAFFSLFRFFLKKKQYSFNEYVTSLVPISALLMIMSMGFVYMGTKNNSFTYVRTGEVMLLVGALLLSFALSHTSILICRNQLHNEE